MAADKNYKPKYATIDYGGKVCLCDEAGHIIYGGMDKVLFPEFWRDDPNWPHDPVTGKKLPIFNGR